MADSNTIGSMGGETDRQKANAVEEYAVFAWLVAKLKILEILN